MSTLIVPLAFVGDAATVGLADFVSAPEHPGGRRLQPADAAVAVPDGDHALPVMLAKLLPVRIVFVDGDPLGGWVVLWSLAAGLVGLAVADPQITFVNVDFDQTLIPSKVIRSLLAVRDAF